MVKYLRGTKWTTPTNTSLLKKSSTEIRTKEYAYKLPTSVIREIVNLKRMRSNEIISLDDVVYAKSENGQYNIVLVFEYMEHDMLGLVAKKIQFEPHHIKTIFRQIVQGVLELQQKNLIHRDLKSNLTSGQYSYEQ